MKTSPRDSQPIRTGSPVLTKLRRHGKAPVTTLLLACFSLWTVRSGATDGFWDLNADGNWTGTPANWVGGIIPNGAGDVASFRKDLTANRVITLNAPITVGGIHLGDLLGGNLFTFAGSVLTFDNGASEAFFSKYGSATDVWQAPLALSDDLNWNLFAGTLDVNGASNAQVSYTGGGDTIKNGAGTLRLNITPGYAGDWEVNLGTINLGGVNSANSQALGTGTGGIVLNGSGRADLAVFSLNNNGTGSDSLVTYSGNNDVFVQGGGRLHADRNFISGANDRVTHVLDQLTIRGGVLQVTSGSGHNLRIDGTTTLQGEQNVFDIGSNTTATRANLELIGAVVDGGAGRNLIKEGAGRLHLQNGANSYGGATAVRNGVLSLGPGAKVGTGGVVVNGGVLSVPDVATLNAVSATVGGLQMVGQLGTSRFALPMVGYYGLDTIDGTNPLNFQVPVAGAVLGIDGMSGTTSESSATIDMNFVGGGSERVWFGNVTGGDRFFRGTLFNSANSGTGDLRITSGGNTLVFDTTDNSLGGAGAMNRLVFGVDHQNAIGFTGNNLLQAATGTISVRVNNSTSLGAVLVNRGVTVNINGTITSPLGSDVVTSLGGALTTDASSLAQFGNTDFRLFGGGSLTLDNSGVTTANANRRLQLSSDIDLTSSTLRLIGDGGAATVSSQTLNSLDYSGGATVSIDTDGTAAGRLTTLNTGSLNRVGQGTLILRNIANTATTFGTAAGTQKLIVTLAPAVTNDMIGANVILWGGANANDSAQPMFTTYDATHGIQAATFDVTSNDVPTLNAATAGQIVDITANSASGNLSGLNLTAQAVRILVGGAATRSVAGTVNIGTTAAAGQGAGLSLVQTRNEGVTHGLTVNFGSQEGLLYVASTGGSSAVITLSGAISGSNGLTRFGDGILSLTGTNTFTGPLTINSGETRLNRNAAGNIAAAPASIHPAAPAEINLWGGALHLNESNQRLNANLNFFNDSRFGDVNVSGSAVNNITIQPRVGSNAPVVAWFQDQLGGNISTAYGSLILNGPAQLAVGNPMQINAGISGTGRLDRFMNDRLYVGGDSSGYSQPVTAYAGSLQSLNPLSTAKPFGTGPITLNPGSMMRLAAASNVNAGQVAIRSDLGGISGIGLSYNSDPVSALAGLGLTVSSNAPWKGFFGVGSYAASYSFDQSASGLWGGNTYLGSVHGDVGVFTGSLTPTASNQFLLGTGQGALRIARDLSGANAAVIGVSMTGDQRADQVVNNSGGVVQYDVPMTYTGNTILNSAILRIHNPDALNGTGDLIANGGQLRGTPDVGQARFNAPINLTNDIRMMGDFSIQMENVPSDLVLDGDLSLSAASGGIGLVRTLTIGVDGNNVGNVVLNGGIIDGAGSAGNHFVKAGYGTLFLGGNNTLTGTITVTGGLLGVNGDADFGTASQVLLPGGGLGVFENSFTSNRNLSFHGGNGWLDVSPGLTFTQGSSSTYDGTSFLMKRGLGTVVLNGENAQTGIWIGDGVLQINRQEAIGNMAETGADRFQFGADFSPGGGTASRHLGGTLRIQFTGASNRGLTFNNNGSTNYSGGIDVVGGNVFTLNGVIQQGSEFDHGFKTGAGTLFTTANNTARRLAMVDGVWQFSNSTPWANNITSGTSTEIQMMGGTLHAINTGADIAVANGSGGTTNYNYGGGLHLRMSSGAGFDVTFDADALIRQNQGTLVLETGAGTTLGGAVDTNAGRLLVTNAINSSVARASALTNGIFAAHLIGADSSGTAFFLENDATNGFRAYSGATTGTLAGLNATGIGEILADPMLSGTNNSIYAFRASSNISGGTLRVTAIDNLRDGGILINGSHTISTHLIFDPTSATSPGTGTTAEGLVYVKTGETAAISGNITANAFTKFGDGTLVLGGNNLIAGDVSVQDGILRLSGSSPLSPMNSELNLNGGATLDLNGTSISVETLDSNNRRVDSATVGGQVTNTSGTLATLAVASGTTSAINFAGTINGNLRLMKAGTGVLNIDGYRPGTPDSGNNTYSGGTAVFGVNTTGGINLNNATTGFGGFGGAAMGDVDLYSGTLGLLFSGNWVGVPTGSAPVYNNLAVKFGAESGNGMTVNVRGPATINVNQVAGAGIGQGNLMQIGDLNVSNNTLALSGGNFYRLRVAGTTTLQGLSATFHTNSASTAFQLDGKVTGAGTLVKTGDGTMPFLILSNPANDFSGGLNILGGDVQNPNATANTLGSGPVTVFPEGTLHLAGNGGVIGANLRTLSRVNAMGAVALDENFNPTVLTSSNFSSVYNTTLQLGQQMFSQALDLSTIGDGRAFLGSGMVIDPIRYLAPTLGAGVADAWNPGVGVYRLVGGVTNFALEGPNNVLTGTSFLQVGPQRNMVLGTTLNSGNGVYIRNSNNYSGGTQIAEGTILISEVGGSPVAETAFGSGSIEVYGELRYSGSLGSNWNAIGSAPINSDIRLRPGGLVRLIDGNSQGSGGNLVTGDQGRWGDAVGIDLNGGQFRLDGAANWNTVETIGDVTVRKGGIITVARATTASSAQLNVGNLDRFEQGTLTINYNNGFLGTNLTTPLSFERLTATQIDGVVIGSARSGTTTNGAGVINSGMVAPWIVDRVTHSYLGYDPTGTGTGFQPLVGAAPGAGQVAYNKIVSGALSAGGLVAGDIADLTTAAKTLADNPTVYALRSNQNISPTATNNTLTLSSGGWILNGGTINPTGAVTAGVLSPMTVNFGPGGAGEAIIYNGGNATLQAQIVAAQGLTKFGASTLTVNSINPGLGGTVAINEGTIVARVPFSGTGTPLSTGVFNGRDVILNGGTLQLDPFLANAAGTASEIASNVRATALFDSNIIVRGDASLNNNGQSNYVRIPGLTFENGGGASAMNGNGVISLNLQNGLWVDGTTTLIPQAVFNMTFNAFAQSTFAGQVTGAADLEKFGNGTMTFLNAANNYSGGTIVHGATAATAASIVASALRGAGTPFGSGAITVNPGGLLRITDNANIASNPVTLRSDGIGLAGLGIAHNGALPTILTTGTPAAGQVKIESTGPFGGVLALDYGYYSRDLDLASIGNGDWWLGGSLSAETFYFNDTLGANSNGRYQLGGGGNQSSINFGSVFVSGARTTLFENLFSGGTSNSVRVEAGALTDELFANGPSFVNGNAGTVVLPTRNTGLVGDVRVNTNTSLALGNNFALGSGRLVLNGGNLRYDGFAPNNYQTTSITIDNDVLLQGDWSTTSGNELVINGNVAMHDGTAGATRIWNLTGTGAMAVGLTAASSTHGVISGLAGSNLIKRGAQQVSFRGMNTYQGFTQIDRGQVVVVGDVAPNVAGPLGVSNSPLVLGVESANNAGSLGIGGKWTVGRDIVVGSAPGTGINLIEARTNERAIVSGGISVASGAILTLGAQSPSNTIGQSGVLELRGPISGAGAVVFGTTAAATSFGGIVALTGNSNGYGINTFSGGTTFNTTRVQIGGDTLYSGPATNPVIVSGPLGTGAMTWTGGEAGNGFSIEATGGDRTIVNAFAATSTAGSANFRFMGHEALTFTRDWNINSDTDATTVRSRTFVVNNSYDPITFSGNLSASGVTGANLVKTGVGLLVLSGTNTQANLLATDGNYGTGIFIDSGVVRVGADAALGSTAVLAAAGPHLAGPADVRLRGGTLSISSGFTTARQVILTAANSGIDVAAGQTLTLSTQTAGAFSLVKTGLGSLALNNSANTITALTLGGAQQLNPVTGLYSHIGGTVSTTATSGTPFGTTSVTIHSGTLSLADAAAQVLTIPTLTYGAAGQISTNGADVFTATALTRGNTFNSVNYGTLTLLPSALANLGVSERVTTGTAQTVVNGTLATPSVFARLDGVNQPATFVTFAGGTGFSPATYTLGSNLNSTGVATDLTDVGITGDTLSAAVTDVYALRTAGNIAVGTGSSLRIGNGGLILNPGTGNAPISIAPNLLFGTGSGALLTEAIVYAADTTGASVLSGTLTARDFTKTGPGTLEIAGASNSLSTNATRLPVVSVQNGTLRFASSAALFSNANRTLAVNNVLGDFVLNVNEAGVLDLNGVNTSLGGLSGNGTITSGVAGPVNLAVKNGFAVDPTFAGSITDGVGTVSFTRTGNGILILTGHNAYTGGTKVQAGRVTNAAGSTGALGRLEAQKVTGLGSGPISLEGGTLTLNATSYLNFSQTANEVSDGIEVLLWGGGNGYDVTVANSALSNGAVLPVNLTSVLNAGSQNALIGSLTVNAPMLTSTAGLIFVGGASTFSQPDTVVRTAGGRVFLQGQVNAAGNTITKTGANDLVVSHTEGGVDQSNVGLWKVYGGILNARSASGSANPLGLNPVVEINGGSTSYGLLLSTDGDGTAASERVTTYANTTLRFGSPLPVSSSAFVSSGAGRIATDRILSNNDDKTVVVNNLEVRGALGSPYVYYLSGNSTSLWIEGGTDFQRDFNLQADGTALTFNGAITGNGSLSRRSNGANVFFNAVNTYDGGTFFNGGGRNLLGSYEGNQVTLSNTAKLGLGHVFQGPISTFQINDAGNLRADQNLYVTGNLSWAATFGLAADLSLEQIRLRALGLGGIQSSATDYFLNSVNPSSAVLSLGTRYTQPLDLMALGDGMWFLGSATNMVGANGSYDAATLGVGLGNTYRLGAGGATLFVGSNGNSNVLTDVSPLIPAHLTVGAPMTIQNGAAWSGGSGTVVLLGDQNYTGSTLVNRGSTLDFRGTMTTSGFEVYGVLNVGGEAGTFLSGGAGANIPVTLRPGSTLRFDNTAAGVLPLSSTQGRWEDSVGISVSNGILRLQGNPAVEVSETVGTITASQGTNQIQIVRGMIGRGVELRTPAINRVGNSTVQLVHNGSQLGTDERLLITGATPTVTNGMVAPWMISASDTQFLTYNGNTGYTIAGFDRAQSGATLASTVTATANRTIFTGSVVLNTGVDFETYALRLDGNVTQGTVTDTTAQVIVGSGGLISNGTRTITTGIVAGSVGTPAELLLYNNGTTTIGAFASPDTSGQILATGITKFGAGNLQFLGNNAGFSGDIRLQQGTVELNYRNTTDVSTNVTTSIGGLGGNIVFQGAGTQLNLRAGQDGTGVNFTGTTVSFAKGIVLGDFVPVATISTDRSAGAAATSQNKTIILTGGLTFGLSNGDIGQLLRVDGRNGFDLQINGVTTLNGRSSIAVENAYTGTASDLILAGQVTGAGSLIKGPTDSKGRELTLTNVTSLNNWSQGTVLQGGTLRVYAKAPNVASGATTDLTFGGLGAGAVTLMQGLLDLRLDSDIGAAADTNLERVLYGDALATTPNVILNGSTQINVDRIGGAGTTKQIALGNLTMGSQWLTATGGNSYSLEFSGTTTLLGSPTFNNSADLTLNGAISANGGGVIFNKSNTAVLWINSANPTLAANVYVNAGLLTFGNRLTASNTANLGVGDLFVNPGASIRVNATANINTGSGQQVVMTGTPYSAAVFRSLLVGTQANYVSMIASGNTNSNQVAVLALEANNNNALDFAGIGNGRLYLGANGDRTYGAPSIAPGLANLPNSVVGGTSTNPVHRFTHTVGTTLIINLSSGGIGNLGGVTPTDVQIGSQAYLGPNGNWGSNGYVYFQDQNTYTGQTVVSRFITLRFNVGMAAGDTAGPLGANAAANIDVYGGLRVESGGSLLNAAGTANFYNNLRLHPGSLLTFYDIAAGGTSNRWHDSAPIALDGVTLQIEPVANTNDNSERFGAITFDRGGRIYATSEGTGDSFVFASSITRAAASPGAGTGRGTMVFVPSNTAVFGAAATPGVAQQQVRFDTAPTASGTAGVVGMLPGYYIDGAGARFVTHGANGITPVADGSMVAMPTGAGLGTEVVNLTSNTTMSSFETSIFALRSGAFTLNSPTGANNDATITFTGSGSDIGSVISTASTFTINPNLRFGAGGANEALFYAAGSITLNGNLTAGTVTKFGTGQLTIANDQSDAARGIGNGYQGGWVVNEGSLQLSQFGSAGNAHVNNTIVLNSSQQSLLPNLFLRAQPADTLMNYAYTSGRIIAVDAANIDWDPGADDRVHSIADLEIQQSGGIGNAPTNGTLDAYLRVANPRNRSILSAGSLTLTSNAILNVDTTASVANNQGGSTNGAYLTNSISSGLSISSLIGGNRFTKWGDGTLYIRGNSPSFTGPAIIDQGSVFVTHNGSLGTGALSINRYGVLEIGVANFAATNSSVTYNEGSLERWSVDSARSGALNLGPATLQIAMNQPTTSASITLNGGGIQAYQRGDDLSSAQYSGGVLRVINPNVTFTLAGDSFLGDRYYEGANGLDSGKQTHDFRPMEEYLASGAILEIKGVIGGAGGLTKVGSDTVILSGLNNYAGSTVVTGGKLMIGVDDALPTTGTVSTTANGVLDLNGQNQTIGRLVNVVPTTTFNVTSGFVTNAGTSNRTLTVGNGVGTNFSYGGVIQHNVSLTKIGSATMTVTNDNTYIGTTTVNGGILEVAGRLSGTRDVVLNTGGKMLLKSTTGENNIVNQSADLTMNGGSLDLDDSQSNKTHTFRDLSVLGLSELDFGTGSGNTFLFDKLASLIDVLKIYNWSGTPYPITATIDSGLVSQDRLLFRNNPGFTANTAINNIVYYNGSGVSYARGLQVTDGVRFGIVPTTMPVAYWTGGIPGNAWNVGNWSSDLGGTNITGSAPDGTTDVVVSAQTQTGKDDMVLGEDMQVNSLTVNNSVPGTPVVIQSTGGYTLTINAPSAITVSSGAPAATVNTPVQFAAGTATVAVDSSNGLVLAGAVGGAAVTKTGTGALILTAANVYTGATNVNAGTLQIGNGGSTGTIATGSAITVASGATFSVNRSNAVTQGVDFSSAPITGAGSFRQAGSGTTELNAANSYTGGTDINGGILKVSHAQAIGTTGDVRFGGGTLQHTASNTVDYSSRIADSTSAMRVDTNGQNVAYLGAIAASNTGGLVKSGAGMLTLSGANGFSGATEVQAGILSISSETNLGAAPGAPSPAHIHLNGGALQTTASFAIDDANRGITIGAGNGEINTASGTSLTVENAMVLSGSLTKSGNGALIVNATSTGSGAVSVTAGTLGGNGTISGATTIGSGATITAGTAGTVDSLAFSDDLSAGAGSTWLVDFVSGAADFVSVADTLNLGGSLSIFDDNSWTLSTVYNIASFNTLGGANRFSNAFNDGDQVGNFLVHYGTVNAGYITLTAVPEPGTLGLLGLALGGFFLRRLRRRRAEVALVETAERMDD